MYIYLLTCLQVDNSRKEMKSLMTQVEKLKHEKEDLESRYRDLQEKSKRQQNKIQFLQSENERLRQNRSEASSVTSVHHPYHPSEILRSISEPGAYDRRHGREISKKSISQDEDAVSCGCIVLSSLKYCNVKCDHRWSVLRSHAL